MTSFCVLCFFFSYFSRFVRFSSVCQAFSLSLLLRHCASFTARTAYRLFYRLSRHFFGWSSYFSGFSGRFLRTNRKEMNINRMEEGEKGEEEILRNITKICKRNGHYSFSSSIDFIVVAAPHDDGQPLLFIHSSFVQMNTVNSVKISSVQLRKSER